jgi:glycosyltransferase involved in cell wall biosynthesis
MNTALAIASDTPATGRDGHPLPCDAAPEQQEMVKPRRIAILLNSFALGGAQRNLITLAKAFSQRGHSVEFLVGRNAGPLQSEVPSTLRIIEFGKTPRLLLPFALGPRVLRSPTEVAALASKDRPSVLARVPSLARYLSRTRPEALLTTLPFNILAAIWAATLAGSDTRVVIRIALTFSTRIARPQAVERMLIQESRRWYPRAAAIVAVSEGVARNLQDTLGLPPHRIATVQNPVDHGLVTKLAAAPVDHPWFQSEIPVVLGVGRLRPEKDFPTLLRAFAIVRSRRPARLVIVGEGDQRAAIEALARSLAIDGDLWMAGARPNPFPFMARAAALALSSVQEGFPNVLLEALACGCPVVSTDCQSGPAELLEGGRHGRLVPVGDAAEMGRAILETIAAPRDPDRQRRRAADFSLDAVAGRYLDLLLGRAARECTWA